MLLLALNISSITSSKHLNILQYTQVYGDMMGETTIKVYEETKSQLDTFREYKNESYDEVIRKLVHIVKTARKEPRLSKEAIKAIDESRERFKKGIYYTEEQARKRLGL